MSRTFSSTKITPANGQKVPAIDGNTTGYMLSDELKSYILSALGQPNGLATLDPNGKLVSTQLPDFANDVLAFDFIASFPATGADGVLYIDKSANMLYRWNGSQYVSVSADTSELEQRVAELEAENAVLKSENRTQNYRITNLEVLSDNKIKEDFTEDTTDGALSLPSARTLAPYAEVEKVKGKSVVWNLLGYREYTITSSTRYYEILKANVTAGHIIFLDAYVSRPLATTGDTDYQIYTEGSNTMYNVEGRSIALKAGATANYVSVKAMSYGSFAGDLETRILVTDLTTAFGVTETSQVTESMKSWVRAYADAHPQYTAGEVLDSTPTEVKSVGANLLEVRDYASGANTGGGTTFTPVADGVVVTGTGTGTHYGTNIASDVHAKLTVGKKYYLTKNGSASGLDAAIRIIRSSETSYATEFTMDSSVQSVVCYIQTTSAFNASGTKIALCLSEKNSFSPYTESTLTLPQSWQTAIEDYGMEGMTIDLANKTVTWKWGKGKPSDFRTSFIADGVYIVMEGIPNAKGRSRIICASYPWEQTESWTSMSDKTISMHPTNSTIIRIKDSSLTSIIDIEFLYELATPITKTFEELGITPLAEPFIESEAGGTISVVSDGAQADATIHYQSQVGGTI